jgi:hypothetical protein
MTEQKAFEHTMLLIMRLAPLSICSSYFLKILCESYTDYRETSDFISAFNGGLFWLEKN